MEAIVIKIFDAERLDAQKNIAASVNEPEKAVKRNLYIDGFSAEYEVYQNDKRVAAFMDCDEAISYAKGLKNSSVKKYNGKEWIYDNTPQFNVYPQGKEYCEVFKTFGEASVFAKKNGHSDIFYRKNNKFLWNNYENIKPSCIISKVPLIMQYPELKRGCEVTSLAMLLNYKGINVTKLELAQKVKKDTTLFREENGVIYYGNPQNGFVGDIYDSSNKGLGVYHKPIFELLSDYAGNKAVDLTGCAFEDLYYFINKGSPIWIIINTKYRQLSENEFEYWNTSEGTIKITYSEHSVLVTGYDDKYIYINDPIGKTPNLKKEKDNFIKAWEQMGRQAVTIY